MQSRADQGGLLTILALMLDAKVAIEVGTFTGYGAICIARGLARRRPPHVLRGERGVRRDLAPQHRERRPRRPRDGAARPGRRRRSPQLPEEPHVDLAYVDADKTGYPAYYDALVPRLRPGGVLVLDNTLLRGRVLDPQDERSTVMAELNERIAADDRVDSVLLGLSDGVTRRLGDAAPACLISRLRILPVGPFGSSSGNQILRGYL